MSDKRKVKKTTTTRKAGRDTHPTTSSTPELTPTLHAADDSDRSQYQREAEYYAALLEHPECPTEFRRAFNAIYGSFLDSLSLTLESPAMMRATFASLCLDNADYKRETTEGILQAMLFTCEAFVPAQLRYTIGERTTKEAQSRAELARSIVAVLNHPDTPSEIFNGLSQGIAESFNQLDGQSQRKVEDTFEYVNNLLAVHAGKGGGK